MNTPFATASVIPLAPDYDIPHKQDESFLIANDPLSDLQIEDLLKQGFTKGQIMSLQDMKEVFALRFWIIDNSGSMQQPDGHKIISARTGSSNAGNLHMLPCSRWEEIVDCVEYHIKLAGIIQAPTRFRLLNNPGANIGPQQFSVADDTKDGINQEVLRATNVMRRTRPGGCTPLTSHILEIHNEISKMAPQLRRLGKKVVIIIATDGLPTDDLGYGGSSHNQEFVDALRLLEGLPVWVVVRLCTDDENVVSFYNNLDGQLELSLEVLDDFTGEAIEVTNENPWLNYCLPIHRLREFGYHHRVFDMLDERLLTKSELRDFFTLIVGKDSCDGWADPLLDWESFSQDIARLLSMESHQYDPVRKRMAPLVSINKLNRIYGRSSCFPNSCVVM